MAGPSGVWGIDIGQCALKALRGTLSSDGEAVVLDAFDYIEYPKILSQPDAKPDDLIRAALKEFLSRNDLRGDKVAISVAGQSGLARFIKLPPVDPKKIPDIVKYEAKQQIPFALEDVVWDYQPMPRLGEDGFDLEMEVGLFAMKRDQVFRTIQPLIDAEVELDIIQLAPLAIYNAMAYDLLSDNETYDEDDPPESLVLLSMGTETSDLVVTNGFRVWQRSIPLGGNHFTKQITKELKLTFAQAEQVKRNARHAADAKQVYQAMRPVFNDLVTEVQRSIGYFQNLDRDAKIGKVVVLGNAASLPGLTSYLEKNLGMDVVRLKKFNKLDGPAVVEAPAFQQNILSFPVCYGLVLQGLRRSKLSTNLLPREISTQRLIRRKKPWVAAMAASLLLACAFNFFFSWSSWHTVDDSRGWDVPKQQATTLKQTSDTYLSTFEDQTQTKDRIAELGEAVVGIADSRLLWLELLETITAALPTDPNVPRGTITTLDDRPLPGRPELYIDHVDSKFFADINEWLTDVVKQRYLDDKRGMDTPSEMATHPVDGDPEVADAGGEPPNEAVNEQIDEQFQESLDESSDSEVALDEADLPALEGAGWVIEIHGYHFHNTDPSNSGAQYVRNTLLKQLEEGEVELPVGPPPPGSDKAPTMVFKVQELGIRYPILAVDRGIEWKFEVRNPAYAAGDEQSGFRSEGRGEADFEMSGFGAAPVAEADAQDGKKMIKPTIKVDTYYFTVQFCWQQKPIGQRLKERQKKRAAAEPETVAVNQRTQGGL